MISWEAREVEVRARFEASNLSIQRRAGKLAGPRLQCGIEEALYPPLAVYF